MHLAIGYPGLKYLPDLQAYRQTYGDQFRVVNAYEPHEHVYQESIRKPSIVLVRGGGIVASRVLQRMIDDRDHHGAQTTIVHLFRTYIRWSPRAECLQPTPGRRWVGLPGVQLSQVGVGWTAVGQVQEARG